MQAQEFNRAYSPETHGDLLKYLRSHEGFGTGNHFFGPEHFLVMRDEGLLVPNISLVRIDRSPVPDLALHVNEDFLLQSEGVGKYNAHMMDAEVGVYSPERCLEGQHWSISFFSDALYRE